MCRSESEGLIENECKCDIECMNRIYDWIWLRMKINAGMKVIAQTKINAWMKVSAK